MPRPDVSAPDQPGPDRWSTKILDERGLSVPSSHLSRDVRAASSAAVAGRPILRPMRDGLPGMEKREQILVAIASALTWRARQDSNPRPAA